LTYKNGYSCSNRTNKLDFELFTVIVPYEREGYPLAYLLLEKRGHPLERTEAIKKFLRSISRMISPNFFLTDKDAGQLRGIAEVFPRAVRQLCYFHVLQAKERKLKGPKICHPSWADYNAAPPSGDLLQFVSLDFPLLDDSRVNQVNTLCAETITDVLALVRRHYNRHPSIPNDVTGGYLSAESTRLQRFCEMYQYTRDHDIGRAWVYLYLNWYNPIDWKLWALSSIPVSRTTMFVESHWRMLNRGHLLKHHLPVCNCCFTVSPFDFGISVFLIRFFVF
jgi:hypothetical protein